jgi:Tfp pilus assembly protein PilF
MSQISAFYPNYPKPNPGFRPSPTMLPLGLNSVPGLSAPNGQPLFPAALGANAPKQDAFVSLQTAPQVSAAAPQAAPGGGASSAFNQAQIYYALGERYYQSNHFSHAIDAFTDCIQLNPADYKAYNKRGVAKATTKDYAGAFADYSRAIALKPDYYNAYLNRGNLWVYLGDLAGKRGNSKLAMQNAQSALQDFGMAIRINPQMGVAYENRAELYTDLGLHAAALQDKGKAIQIQRAKSPRPMGLSFCPPRIALVLANDDYVGTENDLNGGPTGDAYRMAQKLRAEGFQVITGNNLTGAQTKMKVAEFITKLQENPNAVSLTYYSGHGGSINGNNYLIPVNYTGTAGPDFATDAVSVDYLLKQLKATNSYFNMIFLDACRTPLPENNAAFKSGKPTLKQWETEPGPGLSNTWVEYASRPKQPAMQNNNEGLYTKYLLQYMDRPDLSLKDVSMYTAYSLENDPTAIREKQHSRTQTDLSRTEPIAEAFSFADPCAISQARQQQGMPAFSTGQTALSGIMPPSPVPGRTGTGSQLFSGQSLSGQSTREPSKTAPQLSPWPTWAPAAVRAY